MESGVEAKSEPVAEKRPAEDDGGALKEGSPTKRIRGGGGCDRGLVADVKKVAEMVLVLAAMGKMRGGKGPTDVEKELMEVARSCLAKICEGFAPKDVFPRDAFGGVIEDLGLNKLKEQRLGFRPPKMSIAEKLLVTKRKMEEAEDFSLPSTPHSSRLLVNSGTTLENRSASHLVRMSQPDKSNRMPINSGSFQSLSPLAHGTTASSTSLPYQLPTSEIRPVVSSSHLTSTALPRVDGPHLRSDGRSNGLPQSSQVQANYSASSAVRTPTWSVQPQALSSKSGSDSKVPVNMSLKVEGAAGVQSGFTPQTSRPVVDQTKGGLPSQGINNVQPPPLGNTHAEIGKIVQKLLLPKVLERPIWNPPSMDYMNKALTCQICMSTVTEIDNVVICDACEKGSHLKCLQATNQKGFPRGEWHCGKCLASSNGKPLPPKYGRVMRNVNTPKISSNAAVVPSTPSKCVGASSEKVSQPKVVVNGNATMEKNSGIAVKNESHQTSMSEGREATGVQENYDTSSMVKTDMKDKAFFGVCPNVVKTSCSAAFASVNTLVGKESDEKVIEVKLDSSDGLIAVPNSSDKFQESGKAGPLNLSLDNHLVMRDPKESHGGNFSNSTSQLNTQPDNRSSIAPSNGAQNLVRSASDGMHAVNWLGNPIQILGEKVYYASCCINRHVYNLMDHVLIRSDNGRLIPSKLQAMWEDKNTATKWLIVNQCYFPSDLPEAVGRPCGLESSEVYESTRGRALMVGLIEGPCEVLPPIRFAEESERRTRLGKQLNDRIPPLYLCKWIYDEGKGLFRDITC